MIAWNEFLFAFMFLDDFRFYIIARGRLADSSSATPTFNGGSVVATSRVSHILMV